MIRKYKSDDALAIMAFVKKANQKDYPTHNRPFRYEDLEDIAESYGGDKDAFFVMESDNESIGTIAFKEDLDKTGLVRRFFVSPYFRRQGYGMRLINYLFEHARKEGFQELYFRCSDQMVSAISLLVKKGFKQEDLFATTEGTVVILNKKL